MFLWRGVLDRSAYVRCAAIAVALVPATSFLFLYLQNGPKPYCPLVLCGGAFPFLFWQVFVAVPLTMIGIICAARARDAGLRPSLGWLVPVILFGDQAVLEYTAAGQFHDVTFTPITGLPNYPFFAAFGLTLMALLAVPATGTMRHVGESIIDIAALVLLKWIAICAVFFGERFFLPLVAAYVPSVAAWLYIPLAYGPHAMPPFLALAAYRLWRPPLSSSAPLRPAKPNLWRPKRAALIGAAVAVAFLLWSILPTTSLPAALYSIPVVLGLLLPTILLPTFAFYAIFTAAIFRFLARRDAVGTVALITVSAPLAFWILSLVMVLNAKARERAEVAAIPKTTLPARFGGIVVEGDDLGLVNCAVERILSAKREIGDVLTHSRASSKYALFTLATLHGGREVDSAPAEHILVRLPHLPEFLQSRHQAADPAAPSMEIHATDSAGAHLLAVTYTANNPAPKFPPLLTTAGWYDGERMDSDLSCEHVKAFLDRELLDRLPRAAT
ncbi:hypothetical protein PMI42_00953 [Bradyrhizobium sp. YR681]|uniref:hypothetical protein n=1 Tax=Bradyrhizobium sp. YR681 TaxID=1144344 RepID=UPI0002710C60|nr:hypothetical protein [Bradyrhizobium sp. YR681]EJN15478.1 hypothetical protein PMI42_00953 [Bradyrhizobium sp. YR681]